MAAGIDYLMLDWTYLPEDFFEQAITVERGAYTLRIDDGKVEVRLTPEYFDEAENRGQAIHDDLENYFMGAQLLNSRPFQLSSAPAISKVYRSGRKDVSVSLQTLNLLGAVGNLDVVVRDRNGQIKSDTKAARINRRKERAELTDRYIPVFAELRQIIERYKLALENPDEEFIYLYEVRDAISERFRNERDTRTCLKISKARWQAFGKLANDEPVRKGRHRGVHLEQLRDATEQEIDLARSFAINLIVHYIKYRAGLDFDAGE